MKTILFVLGTLLISTAAFATPEELVPVSGLTIERTLTKDTQSPDGLWQEVLSTTEVKFQAYTTGLCDVFGLTMRVLRDKTLVLKVTKTRLSDCTRPEHEPRLELKTLTLEGGLGYDKVSLANPVLILDKGN